MSDGSSSSSSSSVRGGDVLPRVPRVVVTRCLLPVAFAQLGAKLGMKLRPMKEPEFDFLPIMPVLSIDGGKTVLPPTMTTF
jgi:hypothetical protein